ncbi:glycosyl hydrolase [Pedobacter sp. PACM 27299]|uniref:glycoside hydrolase family 30 protein n=1 Tax=Pedobacter sp. PACM 27299 TaxID=1727164 RepID=UPI0007068743|nr:glycoside hydrolase family 30 protein [Pedobacter sp. PACM 27299]ALL06956.1 glycosyl hydrolase [Pedobacter sp. PACM 27299]
MSRIKITNPFLKHLLLLPLFIIAVEPVLIAQNKVSRVYTTANHTDLRLTNSGSLVFKDLKQPLETQVCIFVDPDRKFQSVIGIGGTITDATAETYAILPKGQQQEFLKAYYDPTNGIGYTLARTTIHSSDFSSGSYTYIEENDAALKTFNVDHDQKYRIPLIKKAIAAAGGKLPFFVSPWSPPAFMKTNKSMLQGGKLLPEFRQAWANYFVKFIKTYEQLGIPIWGLTTQNEPMATQKWESCIFSAEEERDFIKQYLGPTLQKSGLSDKKLIAWDHNRDQIYQRASVLLKDPEASKYIWGIGYHWYETWTGSDMLFNNVKLVHEAFPDKQLMLTEGCVEKFNADSTSRWDLGERYGYSLINDFNSGVTAWTDWNMLLDDKGGPNHVGNFCFAPIHADTKTGKLIYTNSYYYLGHFSKFVRPGARRVASSSNRDKLMTTAFMNTDVKLAVVVMNKSNDKIPYYLWMAGTAAETVSLPHSISTIIIQ